MIEQSSLVLAGRRTALLPLMLLVILGSSWGVHFPILKFAARSGLPYSGIAAAIICGVALALLAISLARSRLPVFRPRTIRFYFVCAILGYLVPYFLALFATGRIDADMVTLITSTSPVITLCLAAVAGIERVSALRILGIGLGLVSVLFLIVPQIDRVDTAALTAMILAFGVPVSYSSYHVYLSKRWPPGFDSFQVACGEALVALGLMLPLFLATGGTAILHSDWTPAHWAILALVAITTLLSLFRDRAVGGAGFRVAGEFHHGYRRRLLGDAPAWRASQCLVVGEPRLSRRLAIPVGDRPPDSNQNRAGRSNRTSLTLPPFAQPPVSAWNTNTSSPSSTASAR